MKYKHMWKQSRARGWLRFCLPVLTLILTDQITKLLAAARLKGRPSFKLWPGVLEFFYLENRGAAFGMLKNRQVLLAVLALAISFFAGYACIRRIPPQRKYLPLRIVFVMLSAGALGNMIDRIWHHYVIDFLYVSLIDFPVFNLADIYVCVSCGALILLLLFWYKEEDLKRLYP